MTATSSTGASYPNPIDPTKIVYISSDPIDSPRLRGGEDFRRIEQALRSAKYRDRFNLVPVLSAQVSDVTRSVLENRPRFVQFSGHGTRAGDLCLQDPDGRMKPVSCRALGQLFAVASQWVECVILGCCFSAKQAQAISEHVPHVIAMKNQVDDAVAIEFSAAFYLAIGAGMTIADSFNVGLAQLEMLGVADTSAPTLL